MISRIVSKALKKYILNSFEGAWSEQWDTLRNIKYGFLLFSYINFPLGEPLITVFRRSLHTKAFKSSALLWEVDCSSTELVWAEVPVLVPVYSTLLQVQYCRWTGRSWYKSCYLSQGSLGFREYPMMHLLHNTNIKCNGSLSETAFLRSSLTTLCFSLW